MANSKRIVEKIRLRHSMDNVESDPQASKIQKNAKNTVDTVHKATPIDMGGLTGFSTASKKKINVSAKAIIKATNIFKDLTTTDNNLSFLDNVNPDAKNTVDTVHKATPIDMSGFTGFSTASNKKINVSAKAITKATNIFKDLTTTDNNLSSLDNVNPDAKNTVDTVHTATPIDMSGFTGFSTASNKKNYVSDKAIIKATNIFKDLTTTDNNVSSSLDNVNPDAKNTVDTVHTATPIDMSGFTGFSTANNKKINVSAKAIIKATNIFKDLTTTDNNSSSLDNVNPDVDGEILLDTQIASEFEKPIYDEPECDLRPSSPILQTKIDKLSESNMISASNNLAVSSMPKKYCIKKTVESDQIEEQSNDIIFDTQLIIEFEKPLKSTCKDINTANNLSLDGEILLDTQIASEFDIPMRPSSPILHSKMPKSGYKVTSAFHNPFLPEKHKSTVDLAQTESTNDIIFDTQLLNEFEKPMSPILHSKLFKLSGSKMMFSSNNSHVARIPKFNMDLVQTNDIILDTQLQNEFENPIDERDVPIRSSSPILHMKTDQLSGSKMSSTSNNLPVSKIPNTVNSVHTEAPKDIILEANEIHKLNSPLFGFTTVSTTKKCTLESGEKDINSNEASKNTSINESSFIGFRTASNKAVNISDKSFLKVSHVFQGLYSPEKSSIDKQILKSESPIFGSGTVSTKKSDIDKADLVIEKCAQDGEQHKNSNTASKVSAIPINDNKFIGFRTASNKTLNVSDKSFLKANHVFKGLYSPEKISLAPIGTVNTNIDAKMSLDTQTRDTKSDIDNAITLEGKCIIESNEHNILSNQVATIPGTPINGSEFIGFRTASNKAVNVSESSFLKASHLFKCLYSPEKCSLASHDTVNHNLDEKISSDAQIVDEFGKRNVDELESHIAMRSSSPKPCKIIKLNRS